jgi:hypothetical protein
LRLGQIVERAAVAGDEVARDGGSRNPIQTRDLFENILIVIQTREIFIEFRGLTINIWIAIISNHDPN